MKVLTEKRGFFPLEKIHAALDAAAATFQGRSNPGIAKRDLLKLRKWYKQNAERMYVAYCKDMVIPAAEFWVSHNACLTLISEMMSSGPRYMRVRKVSTPVSLIGMKSRIIPEPKGMALIMPAGNWFWFLLTHSLAAGIMSGCPLVIKPPEYSPHLSALVCKMLEELNFGSRVICIMGDKEHVHKILEHPKLRVLHFTGSTETGKILGRICAERNIDATLELGGMCPAIVTRSADIPRAAAEIVDAKFMRAGQTCTGVNHVYVESAIREKFMEQLDLALKKKYGVKELVGWRIKSGAYSSMINEDYASRVGDLIADAVDGNNATIIRPFSLPTEPYAEGNFVPPTILENVPESSRLHHEECFGPVLRVETFDSFGDLLEEERCKPAPLAAYLYSTGEEQVEEFTRYHPAGHKGICNAFVQMLHFGLPFGGNGDGHKGKSFSSYGLDVFVHLQTVTSVPASRPRFSDYITPSGTRMSNTVLWLNSITARIDAPLFRLREFVRRITFQD